MKKITMEDRFRAEYWQLKIREERLSKMLDRWANKELDFEPNCPLGVLECQLITMRDYILILRKRAEIEGIDLYKRVS